MSKFDNCKFRSDEEEDITDQACCGNKPAKKKGYICWHLLIAPLEENICEKCELFIDKNHKQELKGNPFS